MKLFFRIVIGLFALLSVIFLWAMWSYLNPTRQKEIACYLNNQICMDVFYYDRPDENRSDTNIYFANHELDQKEQFDWRNQHLIYPPSKMFGNWRDCREVDDITLVCSFQNLPALKGVVCNTETTEQYPLKDWELKFLEIKVIDFKQGSYSISEISIIHNKAFEKWKSKQSINPNLWIYC